MLDIERDIGACSLNMILPWDDGIVSGAMVIIIFTRSYVMHV